jgi:hypothetical protein
MPPAGAQPVRTAITVSTSATRSGGSEKSSSEIAPTTPARRGKRPLPEIRPNGTPMAIATRSAVPARSAEWAARVVTSDRTGWP